MVGVTGRNGKIRKIRSKREFKAKEDKDSLECAEGRSRGYFRACKTNKNRYRLDVAQNSVLLFRRTLFGRQGAYPALAQTSSNGHMQNQHKTSTFLALTPGGVLNRQSSFVNPSSIAPSECPTECKTSTKLALF